MESMESVRSVEGAESSKGEDMAYGTQEVAALTNLTPSQIRHYVRRGLVGPVRGERDEYRFSFRDVVLLRTAKRLLNESVTPRRMIAVLNMVSQQLTNAESLASVRIQAEGNTVLVRDERHAWNPETRQQRFAFPEESVGGDVQPITMYAEYDPIDPEDLDSDDWYNLGLDLEEFAPERAPEAYYNSITLDPKNADAHVNLGRMFQMRGDLKHAKRHYQLAIAAAPKHQLAFYNLGTVFDELNDTDQARNYYLNAQEVPNAHYNLARIYKMRGDEFSSTRHIRMYHRLNEDE